MPKEIDDLLDELDHTWEVLRSTTQDTANRATDALVREQQRQKALETRRSEAELREKYDLERK